VFAQTCFSLPNGPPMDVDDFPGPIQTMTIVVPRQSSQKSISALAAYFVFGFGADSGVPPWTDNTSIFRRSASSGTQNMIASAIGVPAALWKGNDAGNTMGVISKLGGSTTPEATIGILGATDVTDTVSQTVRILAYKHYGQSCGYLPDSAEGSKDKVNVRDGHYAIWGPIHVLSKVDSNHYPLNPNARRVVNYITGSTAPPGGLDLIQLEAINNVVPSCAMRVKRTQEVGEMVPFTPLNGCGCYFEQVATGHTTCQACTKASDCPSSAPSCNFGFCELQ
jgi:hypothetical protein